MKDMLKDLLREKLTESWDWKSELDRAGAAADKEISTKKIATANDDEGGGFNPKIHGLYKADKSAEVLSPAQVLQQANAYITKYKMDGYKVEDVSKNADGSVTFTTIKDGKVRSHTFHKTGGMKSSNAGTTTAGEDDDMTDTTQKDPGEVSTEKKGRGRPKGSLGAAKKAAVGGDSGKSLQDILLGKIQARTPSKLIRKVKFKQDEE